MGKYADVNDPSGIRGGCLPRKAAEFGHHAVTVVTHHDYHATLRHLIGSSGEQASFERPAEAGSLFDGQGGKIVTPILS